MEENKVIGANIKRYRKSLDLSQQELAAYLNITREEVSYYENGNRNIPSKIVSEVAKLIGIDEYDLFEENPSKNSINVAFAFRAANLETSDLISVAEFKKIARNYLKMQRLLKNE